MHREPPSEFAFVPSFDLLHEEAQQATGLSDFGDPAYRDTLRFLLDCFDRESKLGKLGRIRTRAGLLGALQSRLQSVDRLANNSGCLDAELERPLIIMGLPRTGTTALHKLLAADPETQCLEYWLGCEPDIRPPRGEWKEHPSYRAAAAAIAQIYDASPDVESIHSMQPDQADECRLLFLQDFLGLTFSMNATLPSYEEWLLAKDMLPAYQRYRDNLKLIGARTPSKRWVLKNSSHLWAMDALAQTLPTCCVVQTHRDPVELIPSISSLVFRMRKISEPEITKQEVGRQQLNLWAQILERNLASRADFKRPVLDVHFDAFVTDPVGTSQMIYTAFDFAWTEESERNILAWATRNRKEENAAHRYSAEEYGLSDAEIAERFQPYLAWQQEIRLAAQHSNVRP